MDVSFLEEAFPNQLQVYVSDFRKRAEQAEKERDRVQEKYDRVQEKCDRALEKYDSSAQKIKRNLINRISQKYETNLSQRLVNKIQSVNSIETLFDIRELLPQFDSVEEFEKNLDKAL